MDNIKEIRANIKTAQVRDFQRLQEGLLRPSELSPEQAAEQADYHCLFCGDLLIPRVETFDYMGNPRQKFVWSDRHGCDPEKRAAEKIAVIEAEREIDAQRELYLARLKLAGLRGILQDATFDTFQPRPDWVDAEQIKARVTKYTDQLLAGHLSVNREPKKWGLVSASQMFANYAPGPKSAVKNWLILFGGYGLGKSHLAAAIIREAIDRGRTNCYFRGWVDYLQRLQWSWNRDGEEGEKEADIVRELQEGDIVVIDDLDKRAPTEFVRGSLYSVLHFRYQAGLPTILTFNYGPDDVDPKAPGRLALEAYLGKAVLDRLLEAAYDAIEFTGPSYRSGVRL